MLTCLGRPMPGPLLTPNASAYEACLAQLQNGSAAADQPALIAQPRNETELIEAIQLAQHRDLRISVCSGSHSAHCAREGTLMLDLARSMNRIDSQGDRVTLQGGATMGALLQTLAPQGRMVPVGTHATPGFGLLTMGGIGHLSRSLGLTLDHVEALRGVTALGEPFAITAADPDQELWTLLRGGAIFLAVITEATLRTEPRKQLQLVRKLESLDHLDALLSAAEALPQQAACSFILGVPPDAASAQALTYAVVAAEHAALLAPLSQSPGTLTQFGNGLEELAGFELPRADGSIPPLPPTNGDRRQRMRTKVFSISLPRGQASRLAAELNGAMANAPNRDCRIDLQHVGGVDGDVPLEASAYRGRRAEWSIVITAVWPSQNREAAIEAEAWADRSFEALVPMANHYYIVQRHPGTIHYDQELELAYGPMLQSLRRRKRELDPHGLLPALS
jgi:FAD/FMN-containing dehydrogenase